MTGPSDQVFSGLARALRGLDEVADAQERDDADYDAEGYVSGRGYGYGGDYGFDGPGLRCRSLVGQRCWGRCGSGVGCEGESEAEGGVEDPVEGAAAQEVQCRGYWGLQDLVGVEGSFEVEAENEVDYADYLEASDSKILEHHVDGDACGHVHC